MPLYIARCLDQSNPKIHLCLSPNKERMKQKGMNMSLNWEKAEEKTYQYHKSEALSVLGYTYQHPEDGLTETTIS